MILGFSFKLYAFYALFFCFLKLYVKDTLD